MTPWSIETASGTALKAESVLGELKKFESQAERSFEVDPIRPLPRSVRIVLDGAQGCRSGVHQTPHRGRDVGHLKSQVMSAVFAVQGTLPALDRGRILEELEFDAGAATDQDAGFHSGTDGNAECLRPKFIVDVYGVFPEKLLETERFTKPRKRLVDIRYSQTDMLNSENDVRHRQAP